MSGADTLAEDCTTLAALEFLIRNGLPPGRSASSVFARLTGWPESEAAAELALEPADRSARVARFLGIVMAPPLPAGVPLDHVLLLDLTGWSTRRLERAAREVVGRARARGAMGCGASNPEDLPS